MKRKKKAPLQLGPLASPGPLAGPAGWLAGWSSRWPGQSKAASCKSQRCKLLQLGPGHAALAHPPPNLGTLLPSPPSTLLARPRRLTDSAADRPGPSHLAAGLLATGCWLLPRAVSVQHKVTKSPRAKEPNSLTGLVWYGLPCTKLGANLSHSSHFACPATLQPPFAALLCRIHSPSYPYIQASSSPRLASLVARARLAVCLPSPRPFLNYTFHCARHLVGSCRQNTTQPNQTQLRRAHTHTLIANLPTLIPSRLAVHTHTQTLRGETRDTLTCLPRLLRPLSLDFFSTSFPRPPPLIL